MHIVKKRLICKLFKGGKSVFYIAGCAGFIMYTVTEMEDVLRDAMNGKFDLTPKKRAAFKLAVCRYCSKWSDQCKCTYPDRFKYPKKRRKAQ